MNRTILKINTVFRFNRNANRTVSKNQTVFHLLQQKKWEKDKILGNGTIRANNFIAKNGRFIITVQFALSYHKLTVFRFYTVFKCKKKNGQFFGTVRFALKE